MAAATRSAAAAVALYLALVCGCGGDSSPEPSEREQPRSAPVPAPTPARPIPKPKPAKTSRSQAPLPLPPPEAPKKYEPYEPKPTFRVFEESNGNVTGLVPEGWTEDDVLPGSFTMPVPRHAKSVRGTEMAILSDCSGWCEPKDWASLVERRYFENRRKYEILKDEQLDHGKLLISKSERAIYISLAKWRPDSKFYIVCVVTLAGGMMAHADEFEHACRAMRSPKWRQR